MRTKRGIRAINELQRFCNIPVNIKIHLIKAYVLPIISYLIIPLVTASKENKKKLQVVQNQALWFAFSEKYLYTRNTKTLHDLARIEPIKLYLHNQATKIINKVTVPEFEKFKEMLDNYEEHLTHAWLKKTRNILQAGEPERIDTQD